MEAGRFLTLLLLARRVFLSVGAIFTQKNETKLVLSLSEIQSTSLAKNGFALIEKAIDSSGRRTRSQQRFIDTWDDLAVDKYIPSGDRLRRFGRWDFNPMEGVLKPANDQTFTQKSNSLFPGQPRTFELVHDQTWHNDWFAALVSAVFYMLPLKQGDLKKSWTINAQQFRILTGAGRQGQPTPEGIHRDDHTFIAMLNLNRTNIKGGESIIYSNERTELARIRLEPGDLVVADDSRVMHAVTPILPDCTTNPDCTGYRDMLIIDFDIVEQKEIDIAA